MAGFEVFDKRKVPLVKTPYVTVQRRGVISLNQAAHEAIGSPAAVELLYDRDERLLGLRPVDPSVEHAYPIRPTNGARSFVLSGTALMRYYDIELDETRRWPAQVKADIGVLFIDMREPGTVVTSNRMKSSQVNGGESHARNELEEAS